MYPSSIHFQRRWYYALWVALLGISLAALVGWETPSKAGFATLHLNLNLRGFPPTGKAQAWVGPRSQWRKSGWDRMGTLPEIQFSGPELSFPTIPLPVAYRRWIGWHIPDKTADLLVVKFQSPGQRPRYLALSLASDWQEGLIRIDRPFGLLVPLTWDGLWDDPSQLPSFH